MHKQGTGKARRGRSKARALHAQGTNMAQGGSTLRTNVFRTSQKLHPRPGASRPSGASGGKHVRLVRNISHETDHGDAGKHAYISRMTVGGFGALGRLRRRHVRKHRKIQVAGALRGVTPCRPKRPRAPRPLAVRGWGPRGTRALRAARKAPPRCRGGLRVTLFSDAPAPRAARSARVPRSPLLQRVYMRT